MDINLVPEVVLRGLITRHMCKNYPNACIDNHAYENALELAKSDEEGKTYFLFAIAKENNIQFVDVDSPFKKQIERNKDARNFYGYYCKVETAGNSDTGSVKIGEFIYSFNQNGVELQGDSSKKGLEKIEAEYIKLLKESQSGGARE